MDKHGTDAPWGAMAYYPGPVLQSLSTWGAAIHQLAEVVQPWASRVRIPHAVKAGWNIPSGHAFLLRLPGPTDEGRQRMAAR